MIGTEVNEENPQKTDTIPEILSSLQVWDVTNMHNYVQEVDSLRNSNLLNEGYLTYDEDGHIYFAFPERTNIYMCGKRGEDIEVISEKMGERLQYSDEWIYYNGINEGISRIHRTTGQEEKVASDMKAEFIKMENGVYGNTSQGVVELREDGSRIMGE